ncbi:hypothetical protein A6R68_16713 [Neotoma lepida]|uniref:Sodium-coupled neutral amino acid symporter 2 n=1 Tax=Neotoma lepida TaxID=56216 RepID=A0A1A6HF12_NEOLE|nr:hypothetical protein A6R68_16713 [Neotoma lepida]
MWTWTLKTRTFYLNQIWGRRSMKQTLILLTFVSIFSLYSVHLLLKTANEGGSLLYEQLGHKAFGLAGKLAASGSITMQNIGGAFGKGTWGRLHVVAQAMSSYLFIVKYELPLVIKALMNIEDTNGLWYLNGDYLVLLVSLCLALCVLHPCLINPKPVSSTSPGYLGYTSGLSLLCMMFFLIVVICKKFQIPCPVAALMVNETVNATSAEAALALLASNVTSNATTADCCKPRYFIFNSQTVYAVPILTFSFVCHPAVLPIYEELKGRSRRRMMNVSKISFFAMFLMYLLAALFGYLTFYGQVESELLHTYSSIVGTDILLLVVRLAVLMAVTLTVPVVIFPIRSSVTHLLCASKEFSWWRHSAITVSILAFTNLLVIFVPTIRDIFGFIGASAAAMLIFILPSAFYIKLVKKESMRSVQKIGALLFFVSGIVVMIGSIALIVLDWVHNASTDKWDETDQESNFISK